jgi:hypothetical protein
MLRSTMKKAMTGDGLGEEEANEAAANQAEANEEDKTVRRYQGRLFDSDMSRHAAQPPAPSHGVRGVGEGTLH